MAPWPKDILILTWTLTGVSIILSFGRYIIHYVYMTRLGVSDGFHILGLLLLIGVSAIYQTSVHDIDFLASADPNEPAPDDFVVKYRRETFAGVVVWFGCLYAVKLSFLFFYRTLFRVRKTFMVGWWIVTVFTAGCFAGTFISFLLECGGPMQRLFEDDLCEDTLNYGFKKRNLIAVSVLNIVTSIVIMILPLWQLRTVQMRTRQKIGFAVVFSLATIEIVLEIVRSSLTLATLDMTPYYLGCAILEGHIAVIISTLTAYRLLAVRHKRSQSAISAMNSQLTAQDRSTITMSTQHQDEAEDGDVVHVDEYARYVRSITEMSSYDSMRQYSVAGTDETCCRPSCHSQTALVMPGMPVRQSTGPS